MPELVYLGLWWFTVGGNPTTRRKLLGDTTTNKWVGIFFFYAGASTFSFLSLSSWAAWKTIFCMLAFVDVPPPLRKAQTIPRLVPHLSHRFSLRKGQLSTQQQLYFLLVTMNTRSKTDEKERRRKCAWQRPEVCRESRPYFFRISFSYNVFVLFTFSVWNQTMRHFVTMEIVPLKWRSFLLYAPIPSPVYKPE